METLTRLPHLLGAALRRERRLQNLTQQQLGKKINMRQATISKLEAGDPGVQVDTIFRVLAGLNLEIVVRTRTKAGPDDFLSTLK